MASPAHWLHMHHKDDSFFQRNWECGDPSRGEKLQIDVRRRA